MKTVYRENKSTGEIEKEIVEDTARRGNVALNYHERIIKTYYELECEGKLEGRIAPKARKFVRDVHTMAQVPAYWGERSTLGYED